MRKPITYDRAKYLIDVEHIKHGKSLRLIERENGLSNDTLRKAATRFGIRTRSRIDSIRVNQQHIEYPSGEAHWRATNNEAAARLSAIHSKRMTDNNPSCNPESKRKITASLASTYKNNPTPHEQLFHSFLESHNIEFEFQAIVGGYIADFLIGGVTIELDGRGHASRRASETIRDKSLNALGFHVVRVQQDGLLNKRANAPVFRPY